MEEYGGRSGLLGQLESDNDEDEDGEEEPIAYTVGRSTTRLRGSGSGEATRERARERSGMASTPYSRSERSLSIWFLYAADLIWFFI